jgi:hypothetical protein
MERVYASLDRLKALWLELERAKPKTAEYDVLMRRIRAESDTYKALIDADKRPHGDST